MHHVTNVPLDESSQHPDWHIIKPSVANDEVHNGSLFRLPVAFFTTTLYKNELPKTSPYPKRGTKNTHYWRVRVPFDYCKFKLFLMSEHKTEITGITQIHLLCLNEENSEAEKLLTTVLTLKKTLIDETRLDRYFPSGKANEFEKDHMFVNVSFINPVLITEEAIWDTVKKNTNNINDESVGTLYEWGMDQLKSYWEELHRKGELNQDTAINTK